MKTICPRCNFKFKGNDIMCPSCHYNTMFIPCNVCGNMVATTAERCMRCGNPVPKKSTDDLSFDVISVIIIFLAIASRFISFGLFALSFMAMTTLLIVANARYKKYKDNPIYDASKAKSTLIAITVVFVLLFFSFGIVII